MMLRRARKTSLGMRANTLLRQHLKYWNLHTKKMNKEKESIHNFVKNGEAKVKKRHLEEWIKSFKKLEKANEYAENRDRFFKAKMFKLLKDALLRRCGWKKLCLQLKSSRMKQYAKKVLTAFKNNIHSNKKKATIIEQIKERLLKTTLYKTLRGWHSIANPSEDTLETAFKKRMKTVRKKNAKWHCMQVWKSKAQGAMRKAKAAIRFMASFKKVFASIWLAKYKSEVSFFNTLDERVACGKDLLLVHVSSFLYQIETEENC